jgi:hypothetical protein
MIFYRPDSIDTHPVITLCFYSTYFDKREELLTLGEHMSSHPVFVRVHVAELFSFLCCVMFCWSSSYVLCARDSRLSIRDCPFGFLYKYLEPSLSLKSVRNITNTDNNSGMPIRCHHMFTI